MRLLTYTHAHGRLLSKLRSGRALGAQWGPSAPCHTAGARDTRCAPVPLVTHQQVEHARQVLGVLAQRLVASEART